MTFGLPSIPGSGAVSGLNKAALLISDVGRVLSFFAPPQWGLYKVSTDGATVSSSPLIAVDAVLSVESRNDYRICDFPVESGGFDTYNKVRVPSEVRISMSKSGTPSQIGSAIGALDQALASLDFYTVVMPEGRAPIIGTISNYSYHRQAHSGVSLLTFEITIRQVMVTVSSSQFTSTASPSGAGNGTPGTANPIKSSIHPFGTM